VDPSAAQAMPDMGGGDGTSGADELGSTARRRHHPPRRHHHRPMHAQGRGSDGGGDDEGDDDGGEDVEGTTLPGILGQPPMGPAAAGPEPTRRLSADGTDLGALMANAEAAHAEAQKAQAELASAAAGVQALEGELAGLFGPSDAAQASFQELSATWTSLENAGVPTAPHYAYLKPTYDAWVEFRDRWKAGHGDEEALRAMLADGRRAVGDVTKADPQWKDKLVPPKDISFEAIHPIATAEGNAADAVATAVQDASKAASKATLNAIKVNVPTWVWPAGVLAIVATALAGLHSTGIARVV
jgi:hypothetical protein